MNKKHYIYILICCFLLSGCESMINDLDADKLPAVESRLAVECYLSPQENEIKVRVTQSQPLLGPASYEAVYIKNATVVIAGDAGQITLPYNDSLNTYVVSASQFKIEAGKKYNLSVSDGKRSVKASCTVPANTAIVKSYSIEAVTTGPRYPGDSLIQAKMAWEDIRGEPNYYVLRGYAGIEQTDYAYNPSGGGGSIVRQRSKNVFNSSYENFLYVDTNIDGITFNSPVFPISLYNRKFNYLDKDGKQQSVSSDPVLKEVYFEILNMDENYYKFCKTLKDNSNSDNPFVEPALIYTNIEGGLGCFGAYNTGSLLIRQ
ncbi:DUF4249 domain-containing protein [Dyadobacter psychrotolerans]|uniref:DUF4249 domain-containing protein n=1 Tax=Dyadobacter psychrotolerans TaxID=2541721 RepID=A0A4R5DKG1_9BACT|nr:DUF4249 domain-containing protein [Dyadobacter psychrotolerans]TDE14662.1 DUF4249 domain-containing protein [Dyadobacter psychrotolerans]